MTDFVQALFRIDPTEGLVQYASAVKPYHSKILDVFSEYVYSEKVNVSIGEKLSWVLSMTNSTIPAEHVCGYGSSWNPTYTAGNSPIAHIISTNADTLTNGNTFIVADTGSIDYEIADVPTNSKQFAFVDKYNIASVGPADKRWVIAADIRPQITIISVLHDNPALQQPTVAGNCWLVVAGDYSRFLTPGTSMNIAGNVYTVATGSRRMRFTGTQTLIPIVESVPSSVIGNTLQADVHGVLPVGSTFFINGNTDPGSNTTYTIRDVVVNNGVTTIFTNEPISIAAGSNGHINVILPTVRVPAWLAGVAVTINQTLGNYYYVPTDIPGVFNIASTRYPSELSDYVDASVVGTTIARAELFQPGEQVQVTGSYLNRNDGTYTVLSSVKSGSTWHIAVREQVPVTLSDNVANGIMANDTAAYNEPTPPCRLSRSGDMYVDTRIHEKITFEYSMSLTDTLNSTVRDDAISNDKFFNDAASRPYASIAYGQTNAPVGTVLPHGIDVQLFDIGGLGETIQTVVLSNSGGIINNV